ncbi:LapA family protein [Aurantivibrio infirmus]
MAKIKFILMAILIIFVMVIGWWISSENNLIVSPTLFGYTMPKFNLGTWLLLVLFIGTMLGYVLSWISGLNVRGRERALSRKLKNCEQELSKLRTKALRD